MEKIASPIAINLIEKELTSDKFLRRTNYGDNEIYTLSYNNSPNIIQEIGRLRELTFRLAGGGTGKSIDIDKFDTAQVPYQQMIVWDPKDKILVGGYRYMLTKNAEKDDDGNPILATSRLFNYSDNFITNYLPYIMELGRSFVQPLYQSTKESRKGIFALDNLWDGLGAIITNNKDIKYFFGKVTMFPHFNTEARNMILYFFQRFFSDPENLISLKDPLKLNIDYKKYDELFDKDDLKKNYKLLGQKVRELGENIPPLINSYVNLSPTLKSFGTSVNPYFGNVEETAILLTIADIYESKIQRYISF